MDPPPDITIIENLTSAKEQAENKVRDLQEHQRKVQFKAVGEAERVTALFRDIKSKLDDLEMEALKEISRQKEQLECSIADLLQQLEMKKDDLSKKISDLEKLCNANDPSIALQEWKVDELLGEDGGQVGDLDEGQITVTLHQGLSDIMTAAKRQLYASELTLDIKTAAQDVAMLGDLKTALTAEIDQHRPETPERFKRSKVLSEDIFLSGRHYWEVELSPCGVWQ
ncbi:probable E3 ubiquitin-protein ligase TRIML1 [Rana temporaria]|uniref:probable E3 ubiquitin-protein ligase TRIML1 n=1 Tax=Rana temporaria TaxID=8407 RepID=UPI001AADA1E7|nr:probable E3 ubiquitin-protein ligase TRIML1 [Rana temporaria]